MSGKRKRNLSAAATLGEKYRLAQAERLVRSFRAKAEVGGKSVLVPVFVLADKETGAFKLNPILERQEGARGTREEGTK